MKIQLKKLDWRFLQFCKNNNYEITAALMAALAFFFNNEKSSYKTRKSRKYSQDFRNQIHFNQAANAHQIDWDLLKINPKRSQLTLNYTRPKTQYFKLRINQKITQKEINAALNWWLLCGGGK